MFDRQLDVFGDEHDIAPAHERMRLFEPVRTLPGQTGMASSRVPHDKGPNGETIVATTTVRGQAFGITGSGTLAVWRHTSWWLAAVATPRGFDTAEILARLKR